MEERPALGSVSEELPQEQSSTPSTFFPSSGSTAEPKTGSSFKSILRFDEIAPLHALSL